MIISHKYKFIFIKTRKTAGTSIEVFLSQHCGQEDILTPIEPPITPHVARNHRGVWNPLPDIFEEHGRRRRAALGNFLKQKKFYNHIFARIVKRRVPDKIWNGYFKFCVERNPWDKTLSHYHGLNAQAGGRLTLVQYLEQGKFCRNYRSYTDAAGNVMVDKIIKYESLMPELGMIFERLGIPFDGDLRVRAKSEHRKDRTPYQQVYTPEQKTVIERAFAREIELHGYVF